ncbi:putative GPI ethanolamine phosphate transferase [Triangularia setosa]|uniref:GPI ethanolamine phosphate transferase 2 n=1 Tax=Triangularia setosa TaxID=2587417 RepID=A0AAN6WFP2_9PEZI|nr:putative GPI ethanolamine phosphate transferase [Podospora setosa]
MSPRRSRDGGILSTALLVAANVLIPIAIFIFGKGFFPYKPLLPGLATYGESSVYGEPPKAQFDRLVFMVIDALRSDFVYTRNSGFKFTQSLIRDGGALPFTAHATSPTVTMPRLKAITTGSIPSFLDVVLNLDEGDESSSLASQDTWLAQMKKKGTGKMVMYGDDTWLKLFPGMFDRAEGTTSFFVSDFTEVDNNVTRHVPEELKRDDWNTMVLHYLGLDHIGHKGGPRSPHMFSKQREMDGIVKQIYQAIESQDHLKSTLFVVCGDHGMNDAGNHGASSAGETSPALVFISPKLKKLDKKQRAPLPENPNFQYYDTVEQSDLAPTLAALMGVPIPKNNLGATIPNFLPFWPDNEVKAEILMRNADQIMQVATAAFGQKMFEWSFNEDGKPTTDDEQLAAGYMEFEQLYQQVYRGASPDLYQEMISKAGNWLHEAQGFLSGMASNYHTPKMFLGFATSIVALTLSIIAAASSSSISDKPTTFIPFSIATLAYGAMMFASSYVEEEQHFWYWATTAWFGYLGLRGLKRRNPHPVARTISFGAILLAARVIKSWNQTGQKFAGQPDIVTLYLHTSPILLWCLVGATYFWIQQHLTYGLSGFPIWLSFASATGLALAAFTFKVAFVVEDAPELLTEFVQKLLQLNFSQGAVVDLVSRARAVFWGVGILMGTSLGYMAMRRQISVGQPGIFTFLALLTLFLATQSRVTNIPLFLLYNLQFRLLLSSVPELTPVEISLSSLLLQYASFFAQGGSNAISSIDLSSAYNGIAEYNPLSVGVLTFLSNWAGPVWWSVASVILLLSKRQQQLTRAGKEVNKANVYKGHVAMLTVFTAAAAGAVMGACGVLRDHLFIWTVFSPKYLYVVAWAGGVHLLVNILGGGLLYGLGVREGAGKVKS